MSNDTRQAARKLAKGPKSCQNCRKSKQRCDIPDRACIHPSEHPQPPHLSCHRCNVLKLPCVIDNPFHIPYHHISGDSGAGEIGSPRRRKRNRSPSPSDSSPFGGQRSGAVRPFVNMSELPSPLQESEGYGPQTEYLEWEITKNTDTEAEKALYKPDLKMEEFMSLCKKTRPFIYLSRMCIGQSDFVAPTVRQIVHNRPLHSIIEQHGRLINWTEMNEHLQAFELFMPFIESIRTDRYRHEDSDGFWLATRFLLATSRTDLERLHVDLLGYVRHHASVALAQTPQSLDELASLLALALYKPLLLVESSDGMQWDGRRFISAIITAARAMELDKTTFQMNHFTFRDGNSPIILLRQASLWYTTAFCIAQQALYSHLTQGYEIDPSWEDLKAVETFCQRCLEMTEADSSWTHHASMLLLLVHRYRSLRDLSDRAREIKNSQETLPASSLKDLHLPLSQALSSFEQHVESCFEHVQELRNLVDLPESFCDLCSDYMEFETLQVYAVCLASILEVNFYRTLAAWNEPMSIANVYHRLEKDVDARKYLETISLRRLDRTKMLVVTFVNFVNRWSSEGASKLVPLAPPPGYLCSVMLQNLWGLCQILDKAVKKRQVPRSCLADEELAFCVRHCRSLADALNAFARPQSTDEYYGKGHRDIFQITAGIATRTSKATLDWLAAQKGLRKRPAGRKAAVAAAASSSHPKIVVSRSHRARNQPLHTPSGSTPDSLSQAGALYPTMTSSSPTSLPNRFPPTLPGGGGGGGGGEGGVGTSSPSASSHSSASQSNPFPTIYYTGTNFDASPREAVAYPQLFQPAAFDFPQSAASFYFPGMQNFEMLLEDILATPVI